MSQRPYVSFAEVKQRIPIPDVLGKLGLLDQFHRKGDTLTGVCPLPSHQHGPRPNAQQFKINRRDGVWLWHCFGDCHRGGDVIELAKALNGYDDRHVRFWFAENFPDRLSLGKPKSETTDEPAVSETHAAHRTANDEPDHSQPRSGDRQPEPSSKSGNPIRATSPAFTDEMKPLGFTLKLDTSVPYLAERGLTPDTVAQYGLGLCKRGSLKGYVAIPVYGYGHPEGANPLCYIGRWPGDDYDESDGRPRYKVPKGVEISRLVYGLPQALTTAPALPLIVVEGPFKVYYLMQNGFPSAVSTLTSSVSEQQAEILAATGRKIVLFFDGNEAGYEGMRRAAGQLITRSYVRAVKLTAGREPDDLSVTELHRLLDSI